MVDNDVTVNCPSINALLPKYYPKQVLSASRNFFRRDKCPSGHKLKLYFGAQMPCRASAIKGA